MEISQRVDVDNTNSSTARHTAAMCEQPLTSKDVAAMLGPHPKTIERYAREGKIPGHFKLNRWYFFPSELDNWLRVCEPAVSQSRLVN
jgi:hypothetical protein